MNQRDRLLELMFQGMKECNSRNCDECEYQEPESGCTYSLIADHLIANGVIVLPCKRGERKTRKNYAEGEWEYPEIMRHFKVVE